jgi:DNA-binding NarL/FixJ family response regulator
MITSSCGGVCVRFLKHAGVLKYARKRANGRDAVDLAIQYMPDVVILDISLSVVDGIEATRQIRTESKTTEVMIFTLYDGEDDIRAALRAGARGYILKSETGEHIVEAVEALAQHREFFSSTLSDSRIRCFAILL